MKHRVKPSGTNSLGMSSKKSNVGRKGNHDDELDIKDAIKRPGDLTRKAKAAGMTIYAFAMKHRHDPGLTGQQSRFYLNVLRPVHR